MNESVQRLDFVYQHESVPSISYCKTNKNIQKWGPRIGWRPVTSCFTFVNLVPRALSPSYARCDEGLWPNPYSELASDWLVLTPDIVFLPCFLWYPVMDLARAPRRTARQKGSGYENGTFVNLVPRACDPWEGNEGSGIIRIRHTENCMSTELRMRWQKQNKLFEIFYCFVYKMMIFSGFWWKC